MNDYAKIIEQGTVDESDLELCFLIGNAFCHGTCGLPKDITKAVYYWELSAKAGYNKARFALGRLYYVGQDTEPDIGKVKYWLTLAAEDGDAASQKFMGAICKREKDTEGAIAWFTRSAEQGCTDSQVELGYLYCYRLQDYEKAIFWYEQAIDAGSKDGLLALAQCYEYGLGREINVHKVIELHKKAVDAGSVGAADRLARIYHHGYEQWNIQADLKEAAYWFGRAGQLGSAEARNMKKILENQMEREYADSLGLPTLIEQGAVDESDAELCYLIGVAFRGGHHGLPQDKTRAIYYLETSARAGYNKARYELGETYNYSTLYRMEDPDKAIYWHTLAAEDGDLNSQSSLAWIYERQNNEEQFLVWLTRAAEGGHTDSQVSLGNLFSRREDNVQAAFWYEQAASQGDPGGLYQLAHCYESGRGREKDIHKAITLYEKAENARSASAARRLAMIYHHGRDGIPANKQLAIMWYSCAYNLGDTDVEEIIEQLRGS